GRPAISLSKFWKHRLNPSDCAYSRKSSRACAISYAVFCWKRKGPFTTEDTEESEGITGSRFSYCLSSVVSGSDELAHQHAAVHVQHVTGDVRRVLGCEKCHGTGHVFRRSDAAQGDLLYGVLFEFLAQDRGHGGFDEAGRDRVASNVARTD